MTFDLSNYEASADAQEAGLAVELLDPSTGEPVGATITVCGPDSRRARKARQAAIQAVLDGKPGRDLGDADMIEVGTQMLARCVLSWTGLRWGGKDMECTVENALSVFGRFPWIEAQIDRKASDRRNFTPG